MNEPTSTASDSVADHRGIVALGAVLILLLLVLCGLSYFFIRILVPAGMPEQTGSRSGMTWVRSIYGFGASADEQLLGPTAVAVAVDGTIYVTDPQRSRVLAFHPDGTFKGLIGGAGDGNAPGQLKRPSDVAVDADGLVYISDYASGRIVVFDQRFVYLREWNVPLSLGMDVVDDTLYVRSGGEVVRYALDGTELGRFGKRGRGNGPVIEPAGGVTADGERVYVADALNQCVKAFDQGGTLIWAAPERANAASETPAAASVISSDAASANNTDIKVDLPQDVVVDGAGRLLAVDAFSFGILVIDPATGAIKDLLGEQGQDDGRFGYPSSIAYDATRDWFVVADTANNRVQIMRIGGSGGGTGASIARTLSSPFRVCAIPIGTLLLALVVIYVTRKRRGRADAADRSSVADAMHELPAEASVTD